MTEKLSREAFRHLVATIAAKRFRLDNVLADLHEIARERGVLLVGSFPENVSLEFFDGVDTPRRRHREIHRG